MKGLLWEARGESKPKSALLIPAECVTGRCFLVFFVYEDERVVTIVPPQPSPFCINAPREVQEIVERILTDLGLRPRYRAACIVSRRLISDSIKSTLYNLISYEIVSKIGV